VAAHFSQHGHDIGHARRQRAAPAANAGQGLRAPAALIVSGSLLQERDDVGAQRAALLVGEALGGLVNLVGHMADMEGGHGQILAGGYLLPVGTIILAAHTFAAREVIFWQHVCWLALVGLYLFHGTPSV